VLVQSGAGLRVAGLIHGGAGAICAGPTQVTTTSDTAEWLRQSLGEREADRGDAASSSTALVSEGVATGFVALAAWVVWLGARRRQRRGSSRFRRRHDGTTAPPPA
jgi:hypothetical protein